MKEREVSARCECAPAATSVTVYSVSGARPESAAVLVAAPEKLIWPERVPPAPLQVHETVAAVVPAPRASSSTESVADSGSTSSAATRPKTGGV